MAQPREVERFAGTALSRHSTIDILVNNAGIALVGPVLEYSVANRDRNKAVNLREPFNLAKEFAPAIIRQRSGKSMNVSSQTSVIAAPDHAAYAASNSGLNGRTKSLMVEPAQNIIQVNAICPTAIMTDLGRQVLGTSGEIRADVGQHSAGPHRQTGRSRRSRAPSLLTSLEPCRRCPDDGKWIHKRRGGGQDASGPFERVRRCEAIGGPMVTVCKATSSTDLLRNGARTCADRSPRGFAGMSDAHHHGSPRPGAYPEMT